MNRQWILALAVAGCAVIGTAGLAAAEDLQTVYDHALGSDPTMRQAEYTHLATRETRTQAILNMLPLNASASKTWTGIGSSRQSTPPLGALSMQVNLFSWDNWVALKQANATVAQGEATYLAAQQSLISRVSQQYFAVLGAKDALAAQDSALKSLALQLDQANRRFEVGLIAITDVEVARAARDSAAAAVIAAKQALANQEELLRAITGEKYRALAAPGDGMPLLTPDPASEDAWVTTALSQNATLVANRLNEDISHDSYLTAIGGHLPTINASASRTWDLSNLNNQGTQFAQTATGGGTTQTLIDTKDIIWSVGVTVPIFTAGATQSRVRQAKYLYDAAKSGYEIGLRQTEQQTRFAYQGVISQIAQVGALKQAVQSNQVALKATQAGYEVGTKTEIDVLTAVQNLVQAETNYSQAKYAYLNDIVALRLAAGNLDRTTIAQINGWLVEPPAAENATTPDASAPAAGTPATTPTATPAPATTPATTEPVVPAAPPPATP